ncbi:MAG: phosphoribosyltransferase [Gaiellaceae bacterium]
MTHPAGGIDVADSLLIGALQLFADRSDAGRALAAELEGERSAQLVVVGLARGGVAVAAEVARALQAPLDAVAVRKIGHPWQPEYGIGAVTPGDGVYVRGRHALSDEQMTAAIESARQEAQLLDEKLHAAHPRLELAGKRVLVVDDGLATGGTMIAALRWARASGAARVVAAVPVAASETLALVGAEADHLVCLHALSPFFAVGVWYGSFAEVDDSDVVRLLAESRFVLSPAGG